MKRTMTWFLVLMSLAGSAYALGVGEMARDFTAESTQGTIQLSDYLGKKNVILAFYIKDFTPV